MNYITTKEAGARLGVQARTIGDMIRRGDLRAIKIARSWWVDPASIEEHFARAEIVSFCRADTARLLKLIEEMDEYRERVHAAARECGLDI